MSVLRMKTISGLSRKILLAVFILSGCASANPRTIYIRDSRIQARLAVSEAEKQRGLMFEDGLEENEGMLFIYEKEGSHSFWMKNMRFPLDIIWIGGDKRIVDIRENVPPCREECNTFAPSGPARYVLEVEAGFVKKRGLKVGDRLKF